MSDNIVVAIIGKTNSFAVNSILRCIPNCKIIHVITDAEDGFPLGHATIPNSCKILCNKNVNCLKVSFDTARTMGAKFLYITHGFSILNFNIFKSRNIESFSHGASWYSNYTIYEMDYPKSAPYLPVLTSDDGWDHVGGIQNLWSFDPILINKTVIPVMNLFINMENVVQFDYKTPYDFVVGEYVLGNIVNHLPVPLFCIDNTNYDLYVNLNNEVRSKYAELYI